MKMYTMFQTCPLMLFESFYPHFYWSHKDNKSLFSNVTLSRPLFLKTFVFVHVHMKIKYLSHILKSSIKKGSTCRVLWKVFSKYVFSEDDHYSYSLTRTYTKISVFTGKIHVDRASNLKLEQFSIEY